MQSLVKLRLVAMFFLDNKYLESAKDKSGFKLMGILYDLLMDIHSSAAKVSFVAHAGDLNELRIHLKKLLTQRKLDFGETNALLNLFTIFKGINEELKPEGESPGNPEQAKAFKEIY
jgi:hypothetical protein